MKKISIETTKKDQIIDITSPVQDEIKARGVSYGICLVFARHTTCSITTADLDPGTDLDMLDFLRKLSPKLSYRHPHDPFHVPDHILSAIIGPSVCVAIEKGFLQLGKWQRIILVELDGPRTRDVIISIGKTYE